MGTDQVYSIGSLRGRHQVVYFNVTTTYFHATQVGSLHLAASRSMMNPAINHLRGMAVAISLHFGVSCSDCAYFGFILKVNRRDTEQDERGCHGNSIWTPF